MKTSEISGNWNLWCEYVNPDGNMSEDEFDELTTQEKNKMQYEMFPNEVSVDADGNEIEDEDEDE